MSTLSLTKKELDARLNAFETVCHAHGLRVTQQRRDIFTAVAASCLHPTAEDVLTSVRKKRANVSLDTVYRTLAALEKMDLLIRVGTPGRERFDGDMTPHAHFICSSCGAVYDVFPSSMQTNWKPTALGCGKVTQVNVQFKGICKRCRN